ncbi:MAG: phosphotransferase [Gemmatimonadetes bacterium]|jgi:Ser/Thr protein kinase RdoA (MazF antagonist)|nr:phosphotransferase [Gemmatimonadota bacterium]MBT5143361.1 phosphotransferase [Gemmatimonadota bacterium]MBT5586705.1 phosphotransferase [Gemmatimonadota bacterium]MBT5963460.1 phosphotransferase [Gemmatimonadota bacterium]MBT6628114.1 phosphotransferase [Gemmatimonadota bacterium]
MSELPPTETIFETVSRHWHVPAETITPWPSSKRIFQVKDLGLVRVNFPRGGLSAREMVALVEELGQAQCAVAGLIRTQTGDLSVDVGESAVSIERLVPGQECASASLALMRRVGRELGRIHSELATFHHQPGATRSLGEWVQTTLQKAEALASQWGHGEAVRDLRAQLGGTPETLSARFGLTHGDVRGPNVLDDGDQLCFVDFNCKFEPQLADVVKMRTKWLRADQIDDGRTLSVGELAEVLFGYQQTRPLSTEDVSSFPIVWAVEQAWRLAQDLKVTHQFDDEECKARWAIADLVDDLILAPQMGRQILDAASGHN